MEADGVAYSIEEFSVGIVGIAVPVLNPLRYPVGSLSVAMPAVRYGEATRRRVIESLRRAARALEAEIRD